MVSSSAARTAQRCAASVRLSFKTGLVISDAKAQQRLACSRHRLCLACDPLPDTHPHAQIDSKVRCLGQEGRRAAQYRSRKRNGPRRMVLRPLPEARNQEPGQQKAAGAALAAKRGETSPGSLKGAAKEMYSSMSERDLEEFASTKRKGKPEHVSKSRSRS